MSEFVRDIGNLDINAMKKADEKLNEKGISMVDAINHFFKMINEYGYIPYYDEGAAFNQDTIDAIKEGEDILSGKVKARLYDSADELFADLLKD